MKRRKKQDNNLIIKHQINLMENFKKENSISKDF